MNKKIFILTGEPSGDKLASKVINEIVKTNQNIDYLCLGGESLKNLKIRSIFDYNEITYLGFTSVLLNIFKIKKKIDYTVSEIIKFNPDILFSVDSPDFTLRVAKKVKVLKPNIKTVHLVAPQVWVWREQRVKKIKHFIDHILLLFPFEKKYFLKENIKSTFIGHPLLENDTKNNFDISKIIKDNKKIFSIYPGSRISEINTLTPILINFIKKMNKKYADLFFVFHTTNKHIKYIQNLLLKENFKNCGAIADDKIKSSILKSSFFAVAKSGTISLEIVNFKVPSVIIYKMGLINFMIVKMLVKVKFANIINIAANEEIIPELLQSKCNSNNIFSEVDKLLNNKNQMQKQISNSLSVLNEFKTIGSSKLASSVLIDYL